MLNLFAATGHIRYTKSARYMFNGEIARGPKLAVKKNLSLSEEAIANRPEFGRTFQ